MTGPLMTGLLRTGKVRISQDRRGQVKRMEFDSGVGPTCLDYFCPCLMDLEILNDEFGPAHQFSVQKFLNKGCLGRFIFKNIANF